MPRAKKAKTEPAVDPKPDVDPDQAAEDQLRNIGRGVVSPILFDPKRRAEMGLPESDDERGNYLVELNILFHGGLGAAADAFRAMWKELFESPDTRAPASPSPPSPRPVSKSYFQIKLSVPEWRRLVQHDEAVGKNDRGSRVIYKLWPDFRVKPLIDRSVATVKGDAAYNAFSASGSGITWAVVDSGIDGTHPHFGSARDAENSVLFHPHVAQLHRDFSNGADENAPVTKGKLHPALVDEFGHGTQVAGIIAGQLPATFTEAPTKGRKARTRGGMFAVYQQSVSSNEDGSRRAQAEPARRAVRRPQSLRGVASGCRLVSLKVMDGDGECRVSDVMRALAYVRETLNDSPKLLRVHGVNISVGYDFDAQMFACGQSPLCVEVDRLVQSGVVVVVAAGNTGYGEVAARPRVAKVALSNTINDPGNSRLAITVGATHRDAPHTYGVSFFSSKGPTGDGRLKPDLVAPGERITSCATTSKIKRLGIDPPKGVAAYVDDSGTSLAAPHVSGAIAAFLSIRQEFIQRPDEVKRIFLESATSLGRERYFEGHGLVDLMRAIQSV